MFLNKPRGTIFVVVGQVANLSVPNESSGTVFVVVGQVKEVQIVLFEFP